MDGYEFEYQCAKILKRKHFSKIKVTQSSGDQGIDIIAFKHRKKYGIQCKYYTHPVGNKAVQEAYAGANFYDCDKAVVMTNITFTKSATQLAQKLADEPSGELRCSGHYLAGFGEKFSFSSLVDG